MRFLYIPAFLLVMDRTLKMIILHAPHPRWGGLFILHRNEGIAFSIPLPPIALALGLAVAFIIILFSMARELKKSHPRLLSFVCIISGAISNIFDRVRYGAVIDYFSAPPLGLYFNLADVMIVAGVLYLLLPRNMGVPLHERRRRIETSE